MQRKKTTFASLLKARGANTLQNIFELFLSWGNFILANFSRPCFRQQPIFIALSGNDHFIFTETVKPIYSLSEYLSCFVKRFYFVWFELVWSCQECFGGGAAVAVSSRWAVSIAKVAVRRGKGWGVVGNVNVISSSECRAVRWDKVYWMSDWTLFPCLRQFNRCPSLLVYQWK